MTARRGPARAIDPRVDAFVDGRLDETERRAFEDELADRPDLAADVAAAREIRAALRGVDTTLPEGFHERARARFEATKTPTRGRGFVWEAIGAAAAAAILAVALVPAALERGDPFAVPQEERFLDDVTPRSPAPEPLASARAQEAAPAPDDDIDPGVEPPARERTQAAPESSAMLEAESRRERAQRAAEPPSDDARQVVAESPPAVERPTMPESLARSTAPGSRLKKAAEPKRADRSLETRPVAVAIDPAQAPSPETDADLAERARVLADEAPVAEADAPAAKANPVELLDPAALERSAFADVVLRTLIPEFARERVVVVHAPSGSGLDCASVAVTVSVDVVRIAWTRSDGGAPACAVRVPRAPAAIDAVEVGGSP